MSSKIIEQAYRNFSLYILEDRALLYFEDGLRASIRRALWVARNLPKTKTSTVAGYMMPLHPHGEADGVIQNFTSPFKMNYPYFDGNNAGFGTLLNPDSFSASRYTSVTVSDFAKDVILVDLDIVPMKPNYDETQNEPIHLLPLVPIHILNGVSGIAVGFKCSIVPYNLSDVIEQQIRHLKGDDIEDVYPYFKPLNQRSNTFKITLNNNKSWCFEGSVEKVKKNIWKVTSLPYGVTHVDFIATLHKLIEQGVIKKYIDSSKKTIDCEIHFKPLDDKDTEQHIKDILSLKCNRSEIINLINSRTQTVTTYETKQLIKDFTDFRLSYYKTRYELEKQRKQDTLDKKSDLVKTIDLIKNNKLNISSVSKQTMIEILINNNIKNVDYIANLQLYRFNIDSQQELIQEIQVLMKEIQELNDCINSQIKLKRAYINDLKKINKKHGDRVLN